jgi:hypothetical protein
MNFSPLRYVVHLRYVAHLSPVSSFLTCLLSYVYRQDFFFEEYTLYYLFQPKCIDKPPVDYCGLMQFSKIIFFQF